MKTINYLLKRVWLVLSVITITISCKDDDNTIAVQPKESSAQYVLAFQSSETTGSNFNELLLVANSIEGLESGEITAKNQGLPLLAWRFWHQAGNTVFTAGYFDDNKTLAYQSDSNKQIQQVNNFESANNLFKNYAALDNNTLLFVDLISALPSATATSIPDLKFSIVDANTGKITKEFSTPIDNNLDPVNQANSYLPWVTGVVKRGDRLFVSYHKMFPDNSFNLVASNTAYIAVLNFSDFTVEKLIEDDRTNVIGTNGHSTGLLKIENNDIYSYSSSTAAVGLTGSAADKPSGILRIKSGATEFDDTYFFDVENATNGGKLFWMDYVGNGKALARIVVEENLPSANAWEAYTEQGKYLKLVLLDLINKKVENIVGMPLHANRYTAPLYVEKGKAYLSARVGDYASATVNTAGFQTGETHIYVVDIETATATKGAKVDGISVKGIFKLQ